MKPIVALAAVLFVVCLAQNASAQRLYGLRNGFGPGGNCGSSLYSLGRIPVPPYFALHPPVYYSGIQPTTYGGSPFARQPSRNAYPVHELPKPTAKPTASPALSVSRPQVVLNPHVGGQRDPAPAQPAVVHSAAVIVNPFVARHDAKLAQAE